MFSNSPNRLRCLSQCNYIVNPYVTNSVWRQKNYLVHYSMQDKTDVYSG
jgi:hypothetical protein